MFPWKSFSPAMLLNPFSPKMLNKKCAITNLVSRISICLKNRSEFRLYIFKRISLAARYFNNNSWTWRLGESPEKSCSISMQRRRANCINMGSYNYLGLAKNSGSCLDAASSEIRKSGLSVCSASAEMGNLKIISELEQCVAAFLGVEVKLEDSFKIKVSSTFVFVVVFQFFVFAVHAFLFCLFMIFVLGITEFRILPLIRLHCSSYAVTYLHHGHRFEV